MARAERLLDPHLRWLVVARLLEPYWRWRFASFGEGSILWKPAWIFRPHQMAIGAGVWIDRGVRLEVGASAFERKDSVLRLGNDVVLGRHVTISAAESVILEDSVAIGAFSSIYDSDHVVGARGNVVWHPTRTAPVRIGQGTWVAERVAVLRGTNIGSHCIIGANSVVKGTIPDHSIAVGVPAEVVGSTRDMLAEA